METGKVENIKTYTYNKNNKTITVKRKWYKYSTNGLKRDKVDTFINNNLDEVNKKQSIRKLHQIYSAQNPETSVSQNYLYNRVRIYRTNNSANNNNNTPTPATAEEQ